MTKSGLKLDTGQAFRFLSGVKSQLFGAGSPTETEMTPVVAPTDGKVRVTVSVLCASDCNWVVSRANLTALTSRRLIVED